MNYQRPHPWLHLIWASTNGHTWIPQACTAEFTQYIQQRCIRHGVYLDMLAAHENHFHLLIRMDRGRTLGVLRGIIAHACSDFFAQHDLGELPALTDWVQPIQADRIGLIRRRILRQEQIHQEQSFASELTDLKLVRPMENCVVLGKAFGPRQSPPTMQHGLAG